MDYNKDIRPRFPVIIFGCGFQASLAKRTPCGFDQSGVPVTELLMMPSPELIDHYGIDEDSRDKYGKIKRRYADIYLRTLNIGDPSNQVLLVFCTFDECDTILTDERPWLDELKRKNQLIKNLRLANAELIYENRLLLSKRRDREKEDFEHYGDMFAKLSTQGQTSFPSPMAGEIKDNPPEA
jgi:hypothetical protein